MNYRPSFCTVYAVSNQLFRQVRVLYFSKTTKTKATFQENAPDNSFRFDASTHSTAAMCSSNQKPTVPSGNHKNNTYDLLGNYKGRLSKDFFWVLLKKKLVLG